MHPIKQIIPSEVCLACDVCCRYEEAATPFVPAFLPGEARRVQSLTGELPAVGAMLDAKRAPVGRDGCFACAFFVRETNGCRIYEDRPLDCRLYPFMVTYNPGERHVELCLDIHCPHFRDTPARQAEPAFQEYAAYLRAFLEREDIAESISSSRDFIAETPEMAVPLGKLRGLTRRLGLEGTGLRRLSAQDREALQPALLAAAPGSGFFSFAYLFSWSSAFNLLWKEIAGAVCVFACRDGEAFLFYPPLGGATADALEGARALIGQLAEKPRPMRVEHVPEQMVAPLQAAGFTLEPAAGEYLYDREAVAALRGEAYKSRRGDANRFRNRAAGAVARPFRPEDAPGCIELYREWAAARLGAAKADDYFRLMVEDSYFAHKRALFNAAALGIEGVVAEIAGRIRGYSAGARAGEVFMNLFEVADPALAGLPAFLFQELARGIDAPRLNTLDDSGLPGLRQAKLSYRPAGVLPRWSGIKDGRATGDGSRAP